MGTFSAGHDAFYINGDSQTLAVVSSGGATNSTAVFGTQTYAVRLTALAAVSSTSGVRVKVVSPADSVVSSTLGAIIPLGRPVDIKVVPGQRVSAISNNELGATIVCSELSD